MQTAETKNNLIAGAATSDITPSGSHFLYGYPYVERMSEGVHDRLLSSALYLSDGVNRFMLLSNDVIYVSKASVSRIRDGILKNTGIQASNILVSATHTHSGPVTVNCLTSSADPVVPEANTMYVQYMEDQIIDAACRAVQNASPAEAGSCIADATGIGTNRHDPEGPSIMDVPAVVLKKPDNSYIACMLVCSMHPTILHEDLRLMSGDFPAFTRARP